MSTLTSGILRNRFRLITDDEIDPQGFVFDQTRMPTEDADLGLGIQTGTYFDGNNSTAQVRFDVPYISGYYEVSHYKSHLVDGLPLLEAGIGDNKDCQLSGFNATDPDIWLPILETGPFFDPCDQLFLFSSGSTEFITSGNSKNVVLQSKVQQPHPVIIGGFWMDEWGQAYAFELFKHKVKFTGVSGLDTMNPVPNSDPPLYNPSSSGTLWHLVDTTGFEFLVDNDVPELVLNQTINSGVHAILRKVPYSRNQYQLPLVPVLSISGAATLTVRADRLELTNGIGLIPLAYLGALDTTSVVVTSGNYIRLSGTLEDDALLVPALTNVSGVWPSGGTILIDGGENINEQIDYASISGIYFSGLTRTNGLVHRDGSQIRLVLSPTMSGNYVSGLSYTGDVFVDYQVDVSGLSFDSTNGLLTLSGTEDTARADLDITYYRGWLVCYEPSGFSERLVRPNINVNPVLQGQSQGILWFSTYPLRAADIGVAFSKNVDTDGYIGPIFVGNDYLVMTATVKNQWGAPVPSESVAVSLDDITNIGQVDGSDPIDGITAKTTNNAGEARFVYTPPATIQGMGHFADRDTMPHASGLEFVSTFDLTEIYESGVWTTRTFAIWNDDEYDTYSETSDAFSFSATGRFELVAKVEVSGSSGEYVIFGPVTPAAALDENGNTLATSGEVKTLIFASGSLPMASGVRSFFVSANRRISVGIVAPESQVSSPAAKIKLKIPDFMTGEFLFGEMDDVDTSSFDSIAYLTINPFRQGHIDDARYDPRQLGNVFRIQGTKTDEYLRNKFILIPNWNEFLTDPTSNEIRKQFTFRNRFILEVD